MKNLKNVALLSPLFIFILGACEKANWSANEEKNYLDSCTEQAKISTNKAFKPEQYENYCTCMLDATKEKYPDINKLNNINMTEILKMADSCRGSFK